jgi:L-fucose isomerase-like protein
MSTIKVRLGFVPTYRGGSGSMPDWCVKMRADAIQVLSGIDGIELVYPTNAPEGADKLDPIHGYTPDGAVHTLEHGEVLAEYFMHQKVDGIIIETLDFGDERSATKVAEKLQVPVLVIATKEPPAINDVSLARVSDSYCGTLSITAGLVRRKIPFHFAGILYAEDAEFTAEASAFARAVAVVKGLKGAHIGQIGVRPTTFETVGYDEIAMIKKFGQNVIHRDLSEIVLDAQAFTDDDPSVLALAEETRSSYASVTVSDAYLIKSAKLELAITNFAKAQHLSALAMSCWPGIQRMYGTSVCALYGKLTGKGIFTACETDIMGTLAMLANYYASLGEDIPHFIDWTIQHREDPNVFLSWHCGNAPTCLADDPSKTALRSRGDMMGVNPADPENTQEGLNQFQIKPGKVTFCRLAEYDGEWKMLIVPAEIIHSPEVLAGTWAWVRVPDHNKLYRTLVDEGFIHHASMSHGDQVNVMLMACKFLGIKPVVVD